jgi:hypothetical protein
MAMLRQYVEMPIPVDETQQLSYDNPCMNCSHLVSLRLRSFFLKKANGSGTILCESVEIFPVRSLRQVLRDLVESQKQSSKQSISKIYLSSFHFIL